MNMALMAIKIYILMNSQRSHLENPFTKVIIYNIKARRFCLLNGFVK